MNAFGMLWTCIAMMTAAVTQAPIGRGISDRVLEVRSYRLKPGVRDAFHRRFERESLPLLVSAGVDVVAYGASQHDQDSYFLMRAFPSVDARERSEEAFYGSAAWMNGPRAAVLAAIDTYTTIVIRVDEATLKGLRHTMSTQNAAADLAEVTRLNGVYIEAAKTASASMFEGILADDFLCTLPDGTLLDRGQFLKRTSSSSPLADLRAQDINVRLLGDVAIVHAATTFRQTDGTAGSGRYTDIWARRQGRWVAVAAQFTRK